MVLASKAYASGDGRRADEWNPLPILVPIAPVVRMVMLVILMMMGAVKNETFKVEFLKRRFFWNCRMARQKSASGNMRVTSSLPLSFVSYLMKSARVAKGWRTFACSSADFPQAAPRGGITAERRK